MIGVSGVARCLAALAGRAASAALAARPIWQSHGPAQALPGAPVHGLRQPALDPRGTGYSATQAQDRDRQRGAVRAGPVPRLADAGRASCPSSTPTSSSRWPARNSAWSVPSSSSGWSPSCCGARSRSPAARTTCSAGLSAPGIAAGSRFQSFENIGMALGIMPVTGVPLPFVSTAARRSGRLRSTSVVRVAHIHRHAREVRSTRPDDRSGRVARADGQNRTRPLDRRGSITPVPEPHGDGRL